MTRKMFWLVALVVATLTVAGCGGGGGGGSSPPTDQGFTLTGTLREQTSNDPIVGAHVTVGTAQVVTNSQGRFTFNLSSAPTVSTYSIDVTGATPPCYTFWANVNGSSQDPAAIPMPFVVSGTTSFGTIIMVSTDSAPPPPIIH